MSTSDHVESNRQYYDHLANAHSLLHSEELSRQIGEAILDTYEFNENSTTVLDFACGMGAVSQVLAPECKSVLGVDISQKMVDVYNQRVENQGIDPEEMKAICLELKAGSQELRGMTFDVVVCSQAYHHFQDIAEVTRILSRFMKPESGMLVVVDLLRNKDSVQLRPASGNEHAVHIVKHKGGFTKEEIQDAFTGAELSDFSFEIAFEKVRGERKLQMFIASGKPSVVRDAAVA